MLFAFQSRVAPDVFLSLIPCLIEVFAIIFTAVFPAASNTILPPPNIFDIARTSLLTCSVRNVAAYARGPIQLRRCVYFFKTENISFYIARYILLTLAPAVSSLFRTVITSGNQGCRFLHFLYHAAAPLHQVTAKFTTAAFGCAFK